MAHNDQLKSEVATLREKNASLEVGKHASFTQAHSRQLVHVHFLDG